jgi:C4-dicarboxylate transporter DctQ subunit
MSGGEAEPTPETSETSLFFRLTAAVSAAGAVAGGVALIAITAIVTYDVIVRFLGHPTMWATEVSGYLLIAVAILGAAETLRRNEHFGMTLLVDTFKPGLRRIVGLVVWCWVFLLICGLVIGMWSLIENSLMYGLRSYTIMQIPLVYPQIVLFLGFGALAVALFARIMAIVRRVKAAGQEHR